MKQYRIMKYDPLNRNDHVHYLFAIGCIWYYGTSILESTFGFRYTDAHLLLLGKIGLLGVINSILLVSAVKAYRS